MAARRSTRLSGELDASGKAVGGKRKAGGAGSKDDEGDVVQKKKKQGTKKSGFQPQPVPLPNSSDTPPETELPLDLPPPPPSTKKIARRRESTRALRDRPPSESPPPLSGAILQHGPNSNDRHLAKKLKVGSRGKSVEPLRGAVGTDDDPLAGLEETAAMRSTGVPPPFVQHLTFQQSSKPRPSGPRPASPPRMAFASSHLASSSKTPVSSGSMGPPTGFVRKTRKSMGRMSNVHDLQKDMVMPIQDIRETPVIRKNQEMRGHQNKRSSLDHRGGRASSSWGRGEITMPHYSVDFKSLYRHIPTAYPDPIKARMLLVWCADRAMKRVLEPSSKKGKEKSKAVDEQTEDGNQMIKDIMDSFLKKMNKGGIDTSTFGVPGQESTSMNGLIPHPRNISNRKYEAHATNVVRQLKTEGAHWSTIANTVNNKQQDTIRRLEKKLMVNADPDLSTAPQWMQQALSLAEGIIAEPEQDLEPIENFGDVEYNVDVLHESSHVALQYVLQAGRFLDGIFSSLTADLRARDRLGLPGELPPAPDGDEPDTTALLAAARIASTSASTSTPAAAAGQGKTMIDAMSLLRSLASAESSYQTAETVAAAAKVAPMVALSSMTPRKPGPGVTPRRQGLGVSTPGRYGKTPRGE